MKDLQKYCDRKVKSGYGSLLLYKKPSEEKYHILIPLETTPSVFGSTDTFEYDLLSCKSTGMIKGKVRLEATDVDFMWHRDNVRKLEELQDQTLDFMTVYGDFTARTFTATIQIRPNNAEAEIMRGTLTITPSSASTTTLYDARPLIQDTIMFTTPIPDSVEIGENGYSILVETDCTTATIKAIVEDEEADSSAFKVEKTEENGKTKITITRNTTNANVGENYAIILFTAEDSTGKDYENTTSMAVEYTYTA